MEKEKKLLTKIHDYFCYLYPDKTREEIKACMDGCSVNIALEIAEYAHRNQVQLNGKPYINHPKDCLQLYRDFVGIVEGDYFCIDVDLLEKKGIPFNGVQEVCVLHDVIEDTDVTMDDIREIFYDLCLKTYFDLYIAYPLKLITHDKKVDYSVYMKEVLKNPTSAIVKLMDLTNNMNLLRLDKIDAASQERFLKYYCCFLEIESNYFFIEKINEYNKEFYAEND